MKRNNMAILGLILMISVFVVAAACTPVQKDNAMEKDDVMQKNDTMMDQDGAMEKNDTMMKHEDAMEKNGTMEESSMEKEDTMKEEKTPATYTGPVLAGTTTKYLEFTQEDYDLALAENNVIVLNFYANWCPICRKEQPDALAAFEELDNDNVVGFRVNYKDSETDDNEMELAKQFGVTYQHTKVIIKDGGRVLKAPDSWDKERYLSEIAKVVGNG